MLSDFYQKLEKSPIRNLFPEDMELASRKSAAFFVQILGGPPLFSQNYGPPRMRQRHFPFEIDEEARKVWVELFLETLEKAEADFGFPKEHLEGFKTFLREFSRWMVNKG
jgi:hemoglobin